MRGRAALEEISQQTGNASLSLLSLDLGDFASIGLGAGEFLASGEPLHGLINNAGLAGQRGLTKSGFELAFGSNFVGHFLLTHLLLERLRESAPARIVNVASGAHYNADGIDWDAVRRPTQSLTGMAEYAVSKLANVLHAQELARRLEGTGVNAYALHPGVIATDIWRRLPRPVRGLMKLRMRSPSDGAKTSVYCATSPDVATESGQYYEDERRAQPSAAATAELGAELWTRSTGWIADAPVRG